MRIVLLSTTDHVWDQFAGFYRYRNSTPPPRPPDGIWVAQEDGTLLGGVCLYPCEGAPYVMVEHVATRPNTNPRLLWTAMQMGLSALVAYGTARSKTLVCFPRDESVGKQLGRAGFVQQPAIVYTMGPGGMPLGEYVPKEKRAPEESTSGGAEETTPQELEETEVADVETPVKGAARQRRKS